MFSPDPFADSLYDPHSFTITYELVPGQGAGGRKIERLLEFARRAREDGRITALSVTDNAGGHPALAPVAMGAEIRKIGLEPLIHFSLKDKNRNQVESHLFLYQRLRFRHLLVLGGDFPRPTYHGQARPVYDLDTIQTIRLVEDIKAGRYRHMDREELREHPFAFQCACVVSPFKLSRAEQEWQYAKLIRKIRSGARYVVTQLGYDMDRFEELLVFLNSRALQVPVLANVFIPGPRVARIMAGGGVPGVVLPESLAEEMERQGKEQRLMRAAKMVAVLKGMGYAGVHLGGNGLDFDDIAFVLDQAEALSGQWQKLRAEVHCPLDAAAETGAVTPGIRGGGGLPVHRLIHRLFFTRTTVGGRLLGALCRFCDRRPVARSLLTVLEKMIKGLLFRCRMCGDCTLADSAFLCPQSGCPKRLVNGPCGGSRAGRCEVFTDRPCFWVRVRHRLPPETSIEELAARPVLPPKNWALENSSSWINYFQGRDHTGGG